MPAAFLTDRNYCLSFLFFIAALFSKPMAVTLPLVLLILDWYPYKRISSFRGAVHMLLEKMPFFLISLILSITAFKAQEMNDSVIPLGTIPLFSRILDSFGLLVFYIQKMSLPAGLLPLYPLHEGEAYLSFSRILPVLIVSVITIAVIKLAAKKKAFVSVWAFYIVTLLPMLGLIRVGSVLAADRFVYIACLGPFLLTGTAISGLWGKSSGLRNGIRALIATLPVLLVFGFAYKTVSQTGIWRNSITLWDYVIQVKPGASPFAYNNRGLAFKDKGDYELAIKDFSYAITIAPKYPDSYRNRGLAYLETERPGLAIDDFTHEISLRPSRPEAHYMRGLALCETGEVDRAIDDLTKSIGLDPQNDEYYNSRGVAFEVLGMYKKALEDYNKSISLNPSNYLYYHNRGMSLAKTGRLREAIDDQAAAVSLNPGFPDAFFARGEAYEKTGDITAAAADYKEACRLVSSEGCEALRRIEDQAQKNHP